MKRITQILASILFVITILTIYLAFDFAINNALSNKNPHKHAHHHYEHDHLHENSKNVQKRFTPILPGVTNVNRLVPSNNIERHTRDTKHLPPRPVLRPKPGNFHKGKTGIKVNKPQKLVKDQQKRSTITTTVLYKKKDQYNRVVKKRHV